MAFKAGQLIDAPKVAREKKAPRGEEKAGRERRDSAPSPAAAAADADAADTATGTTPPRSPSPSPSPSPPRSAETSAAASSRVQVAGGSGRLATTPASTPRKKQR